MVAHLPHADSGGRAPAGTALKPLPLRAAGDRDGMRNL